MTKPASDKQVAFINSLLSERVFSPAVEVSQLTSVQASALITELLNAPRKVGGVAVARITELGMYRNAEGDIYKVQRSRQSGNLYAKRLDIIAGFVYEQGALKKITPSDRMSVEQAKEFGVQYGFCVVCGLLLTDPKSVEQGIGPICIKRV